MCLLTILWQHSYLLMRTNWIELAIETQTVISEEAEYYGIYDPNLINTAFSMIGLKIIEAGAKIIFERIVSQS